MAYFMNLIYFGKKLQQNENAKILAQKKKRFDTALKNISKIQKENMANKIGVAEILVQYLSFVRRTPYRLLCLYF